MIVSFHPIISAEHNIICAGRDPDARDLAAIRAAEAVILPQGCMEPLYRMARTNCDHVFPNLDVRFDYPAKSGQLQLLRKLNIAHPQTVHYETVAGWSTPREEVRMTRARTRDPEPPARNARPETETETETPTRWGP